MFWLNNDQRSTCVHRWQAVFFNYVTLCFLLHALNELFCLAWMIGKEMWPTSVMNGWLWLEITQIIVKTQHKNCLIIETEWSTPWWFTENVYSCSCWWGVWRKYCVCHCVFCLSHCSGVRVFCSKAWISFSSSARHVFTILSNHNHLC